MPKRTIMQYLIDTGRAQKIFTSTTNIKRAQTAENALERKNKRTKENKEYCNARNYLSKVRHFRSRTSQRLLAYNLYYVINLD